MAKTVYIPGTMIPCDKIRKHTAKLRWGYFLVEWTFVRDGKAIPMNSTIEAAGWGLIPRESPFGRPQPKSLDVFGRADVNPDRDDPTLTVCDIRTHCERRYANRASLDIIEAEILQGDRKGINMNKLNRDGHATWLKARIDKGNIRFMRAMGLSESDMLPSRVA